MKTILRRRPSPALVIALIALFASMGGVSYGFATGSVDGREIRNSSVRTYDLRNNDVRGLDIRNSTIGGRDIARNTISGDDVNEAKLGKVPSAASADNASSAGSAGSLRSQVKIAYQAAAGSGAQTVFDNGKLKLTATCSAGSALTVSARTSVDNATLQGTPAASDSLDFDVADTVQLSTDNEHRSLVYSEPGGQVVTLEYGAIEGGAYGGGAACIVKGLAQTL